jgi:glycosyltransferase involved in cell wall biosynthesis
MKIVQRIAKAPRLFRYLQALSRIPSRKPTAKIRLAIITGELEVGGVGRVLLNIVQALPRDQFELLIFTTDPRLNNWSSEFAKYVDEIIDIPPAIGRSLPPRFVNHYLQSYLAKNQMDVVFITNSVSGYKILPSLRQKGRSRRAKVYDLLHTHGRPEDNDAFLRLSAPFDSHIDRRIVISNYLKDYFCSHYSVPAEKVLVIYNGIDQATLHRSFDITSGKQFLGLQKGEQAITYLGRLQEDKSPDRLVELAALFRSELRQHNTFIAVVGEGSMHDSLVERAKELGILDGEVRFFPFTAAPLDVCAASLFTILTSDLEGIPMSILESMQVSTPVIAPAVGGIPEMVASGKEGFLADFTGNDESEKQTALLAALKQALSQSPAAHKEMGQRARKKVETRFTTMGQQYLELFRNAQD